MEEKIKEVHHHHYYPYPYYVSPLLRYPYPWHSILPPPIVEPNWYYQSTYTTTRTEEVERYDSI